MNVNIPDFNDFPCGILGIDKERRIVLWNRELSILTGYSSDQMVEKSAMELKFTDEKDEEVTFLDCLEVNRGFSSTVFIGTKDGEKKAVLLQARYLADDPVLLALAAVSDISRVVTCDLKIKSPVVKEKDRLDDLIGKDRKMLEMYKMIELAAESVANIFILGESGTGKELVARAVHNLSNRQNQPFVAVNCSALSETLLESELFGHMKGSFTGAIKDKIGKFEAAHKGTIFLDEIGDISPSLQVKLLRVIQEKSIVRVGANEEIKVDMRIIAATNRNMRQLVGAGKFREDLFYRLKVFTIHTIPLRDRPSDLPLLCDHLVGKFNIQTGKKVKGITSDVLRLLLDYCWPGNVRELENAIEHAFVICQGDFIDSFDLPLELRTHKLKDSVCRLETLPTDRDGEKPSAGNSKTTGEKEDLLALLKAHNGNKTEAAKALGMSRVGLWKKLRRLGIQ